MNIQNFKNLVQNKIKQKQNEWNILMETIKENAGKPKIKEKQIQLKKAILKIREFATFKISEHRLSLRSRLKDKNLNLVTIFSLLPFFLGFSDFLNKNEQIKKILFEKTLPAFATPTECLSWETFRYFNQIKNEFFNGLEKIHLSQHSLFLTKTLNRDSSDQEYFIASLTKKKSSIQKTEVLAFEKVDGNETKGIENSPLVNKEKILSLKTGPSQNRTIFAKNKFYLNLFSNKSIFQLKTFWESNHLLESFYLNLDEIPLKLDNSDSYQTLSLKEKNTTNQSTSKILPFKKTIWSKQNTTLKQNNFQYSSQTIDKINYLGLLVEPYSIKKELPALSQVDSMTRKNKTMRKDSASFLKKQTSFVLKNAITKEKIFLNSDILSATEKELEDLVSKLEQKLEDRGSLKFRRMSGYNYPDMNSQDLTRFFIHNFFSSTNQESLKISLPTNPTFLKNYAFSNPQLSEFTIQTQEITLRDWEKKKTLYNDLSLFLDLKNGLDWYTKSLDISATDRQNFRFWLQNYFSPRNPLFHFPTNFSGEEYLFFFEPATKISPKQDFFVTENQVFVPFVTENEWKEIYNENKKKIENNVSISESEGQENEENDSSLPLVEVSFPKPGEKRKTLNYDLNYSMLNFDLISTLDYDYSPQSLLPKMKDFEKKRSVFEKQQKNHLIFQEKYSGPLSINRELPQYQIKADFFPESESFVSYKKLNSLFSEPNLFQKVFFDHWENFNVNSWLIISQIGFAFFCLNFLKYTLIEYFREFVQSLLLFGTSFGFIEGIIKEEIQLRTGLTDKGYRILSKNPVKLQDLAGIKILLPEVAEIIWFLRNKGRNFYLNKTIPQGILILGPPGTGKTFLVKAIAGEAKVPVVKLSGNTLVNPAEKGSALKIAMAFEKAQEIAPCILFIDEIDSLAQKRPGVMSNPMGYDDIVTKLYPEVNQMNFVVSQTSFFKERETRGTREAPSGKFREDFSAYTPSKIIAKVTQKLHAQGQVQEKQLTVLIQLLVELDGLKKRKGVIVIAATNRPESLDDAILRPGRFDKIFKLGLPNYSKRFEIFKLYGNRMGWDSSISDSTWDYLAKRTVGYSAADLASIMNQSALHAIFTHINKHSFRTIEKGIERITTSEIEKPSKILTTLFRTRVAYQQAGKIVLSQILEYLPPVLVSYLWPRRESRRYLQILNNLQNYFFRYARRCELEQRIVGSYAGKAAEILFLENNLVALSSFGLEDLSFGFVLICFTVEKWYMYSKTTIIGQLTEIYPNGNFREFRGRLKDAEIFKEFSYLKELPIHFLPGLGVEPLETLIHPLSQDFFASTWWQRNVSDEMEFVLHNFADWYRIYIPDPEEKERNIYWCPPDDFYHRNSVLKQINPNTIVNWNQLSKIARDYQVHCLVLQSFNTALSILDNNREFLDKLVLELLKNEVLYQPDIEKISSMFVPSLIESMTDSSSEEGLKTSTAEEEISDQEALKTSIDEEKKDFSDIKIVQNSFGLFSRRKTPYWIDFKHFEK